jgi:hypothetical protein
MVYQKAKGNEQPMGILVIPTVIDVVDFETHRRVTNVLQWLTSQRRPSESVVEATRRGSLMRQCKEKLALYTAAEPYHG